MPRGTKPQVAFAKGAPAKSAGRTVDWGRDEELVSLAKLDEARQAQQAGRCGRCEVTYAKGEWVFREVDRMVGVNCCATSSDMRTSGGGLGDLLDAEEIEGRDWVPLAQVLPRGKTKADVCQRCYMIPAANGVCGC